MPVSVVCTCGHRFRVDDQFAGQEGPCPACQATIRLDGQRVPPYDIFVSYSSKDKTIADAAVAVLEQRGLRCWVAPRDIVAGKEWGEAIIEGIEKSRLLVLIFSQHSNQSQQVVREVERAVAKGLTIIPFRIEDIPASKAMEYFISCHHWLDAYQPPLDKHLEKLAGMANQLLENGPAPKAEVEGAQGVAGKLNAAMNTLLARDTRTRVLIGLAAVLVVAAIIVAASAYSLRDPVASQSVIRAKGEAEIVAAGASGLDPGDGVAAGQAKIRQRLKEADALYADKQFRQAEGAYRDIIAEGASLTKLDTRRSRALEQKDAMNAAREAAQAAEAGTHDPANWGHALRLEAEAEQAYAAAEYERASENWAQASAALATAAENARRAGLPRLQAIAFHTAMAIQNKWQFENARPAAHAESAGEIPPTFVPGRGRGFGIPPIPQAPVATDWPPYQEVVNRGTTFLELEAKTKLGIDPNLIERIIQTRDLGLLDATGGTIVEHLKQTHGPKVEMAYRLGTNVARFKALCDQAVDSQRGFSPESNGIKTPSRGDFIWTSDYALHRATVVGCPPELIEAIKQVRRTFDEVSNGLVSNKYWWQDAYRQMAQQMKKIHEQHFATVEATTALFAKAEPPADPPEFPSREKAVEDLIAKLEELGGWIQCDIDRFDRPPVTLAFQAVDRYGFNRLALVDVDEVLNLAVQCSRMRLLGLHELELEDRHLEMIAQLPELKELRIGSGGITPAGMKHLAKLPKLESLYLYGDETTDDELAPLAELKALKLLSMYRTKAGDGVLASLAKIPTLETLYASETPITDKGIESLTGLKNLKHLDLTKTQLTDASAPHLAALTTLESLNVANTGLTDGSVEHLEKLKNLQELHVSDTKITEEGTARLKASLPKCRVTGN